ncbi:MAG TPA: sulfotransferase [Acidimicrobiia bacterium]
MSSIPVIRQGRDRLKEIVPLSVRRKLVLARHRWRSWSAESRVLPDFLIIGCQRGGTSSIYRYLGQHPQIAPSLRKETEFFTARYGLGERWYRANFPHSLRMRLARLRGKKLLTFEATPDYLFDPRAPGRAREMLPDARIVLLLREPGERAVSQYHHNVRLGLESETLERAIELEDERLAADLVELEADSLSPVTAFRRFSYVTRGQYAPQLERWFATYPRDQILVLESEAFFQHPDDVLQRILAFVGADPWQPAEFRNHSYSVQESAGHREVPEAVSEVLEGKFALSNQALGDLIDEEISWLAHNK